MIAKRSSERPASRARMRRRILPSSLSTNSSNLATAGGVSRSVAMRILLRRLNPGWEAPRSIISRGVREAQQVLPRKAVARPRRNDVCRLILERQMEACSRIRQNSGWCEDYLKGWKIDRMIGARMHRDKVTK